MARLFFVNFLWLLSFIRVSFVAEGVGPEHPESPDRYALPEDYAMMNAMRKPRLMDSESGWAFSNFSALRLRSARASLTFS